MLVQIFRTKLPHHRFFKQLTNVLCLSFEHSSLVGNTHTFQIRIWVKTSRISLAKFSKKLIAVAPMQDIIADIFSFLQIQHNQILVSKRTRSNSFLVLVLTVNNRSVIPLFVLFNSIPNLRNPRTSSINNLAALIIKQLHFLDARPKSR